MLVEGGSPVARTAPALEVDAGVALPVAFGGLRKILQACEDAAPDAVRSLARQRPSEWNRLFPGSQAGAPNLTDLALTPSERRLHRESEEIFGSSTSRRAPSWTRCAPPGGPCACSARASATW